MTITNKAPLSEKIPAIIEGLWNSQVTPETYVSEETYYNHIFEQYKIFIEKANEVSNRRNLANTFFLTLHTLLFSVLSFLYDNDRLSKLSSHWIALLPLIAVLLLCYEWWRLIKSYRQRNRAKFMVIGEYERRLPSSPYWSAEWKALGEGKDPKLYRPLTDVENWIPLLFGLMYILVAIFVMVGLYA